MVAVDSRYDDYWIWTIQLSMWRYAKVLGIPIMDITVKSGIQTFAPRWEDLFELRSGEIDKTEYSQRYFEKVLQTVNTHEDDWRKLLRHKNLALACYCRPGEYCHRHLFSVLAVTYLQAQGKKVLFMGELYPHQNNIPYFSKIKERSEL